MPIEKYGDASFVANTAIARSALYSRRLKTDREIIQDLPETKWHFAYSGDSINA